MSDLLTDVDLKTERVTEPPKLWRNWWRSLVNRDSPLARVVRPDLSGEVGEKYAARRLYPSKDAAETRASEVIARDVARHGVPLDEYLGAYPEGERP